MLLGDGALIIPGHAETRWTTMVLPGWNNTLLLVFMVRVGIQNLLFVRALGLAAVPWWLLLLPLLLLHPKAVAPAPGVLRTKCILFAGWDDDDDDDVSP